jgi:diguanylate cyclase (GGDEF)-like protein
LVERNRCCRLLCSIHHWGIIFLGTGLLALVGSGQKFEPLGLLLILCVLAAGTEAIRVPAGEGFLSLSTGVVLAALILLGVPAALWVIVAGYLLGDLFGRRLSLDSLFNAAQAVIAILAAAAPYHYLGGTRGGSTLVFILPQGVFLLTYFLVNHVLVHLAVVLEHGFSPLVENQLLLGWDFVGTLLALPIGLLLAQAYERLGLTALLLASVPLLTISYIWQLYARVRAVNQQIMALYAATSSISASIELDATLQVILRQAREFVPYDQGILYLADEETLIPSASEGEVPEELMTKEVALGEGLVGRVGITHHMEAAPPTGLRDKAVEPIGPKWYQLAVPLVTRKRLVGALWLARSGGRFSEREVQFLAILTGQAAIALDNARLYSEVATLAQLDALTGIYNRRTLVENLAREISRCSRYGLNLTVLMVDLDNFKKINDTCGHQFGDVLLKKIISSVASSVRSVDIVGRYGGDEIVVILPETGPLEAYQVAERIRQAVKELTRDEVCQVTTSIGIAAYPQHGEDPERLLAIADQAMYHAKRQGGDRILTGGQAQLGPVYVEHSFLGLDRQ